MGWNPLSRPAFIIHTFKNCLNADTFDYSKKLLTSDESGIEEEQQKYKTKMPLSPMMLEICI